MSDQAPQMSRTVFAMLVSVAVAFLAALIMIFVIGLAVGTGVFVGLTLVLILFALIIYFLGDAELVDQVQSRTGVELPVATPKAETASPEAAAPETAPAPQTPAVPAAEPAPVAATAEETAPAKAATPEPGPVAEPAPAPETMPEAEVETTEAQMGDVDPAADPAAVPVDEPEDVPAPRAAEEEVAPVATSAPAPEETGDDHAKPATLDAPREGGADDFKQIKGIGPKLEELLHSMGFYHFDQIASWSDAEIAWVDANLEGFRGRVTRDDWVGQARELSKG
ncbi:hypothetical protein [Roseobacter sp. HKCCA0434]|uniref:hypothetical protein n=1 Tax=Roseobacter sp. HKCCA0434 TaxID=3079297 RepID=UPI002905A682|nr:hypothetical protein [Roseobacter sp. HKCCA0434]